MRPKILFEAFSWKLFAPFFPNSEFFPEKMNYGILPEPVQDSVLLGRSKENQD
jgi:hypothetical protein